MKHSVLVVDDEPIARRTLREYLGRVEWVGKIEEASDGLTAIRIANTTRPHLILLDIQMPGATGLEVLSKLDYQPHVIFTTAFDQYAVAAFELGAIDYVVKPFARERLMTALRRAQSALRSPDPSSLLRAKELLGMGHALSRIFVRDGGRILPVPLVSLERVEGADDYVILHSAGREYLVYVRLAQMEEHLAHAHFLRIHRSHLINLEHVISVEPYDATRVEVVMRSGVRIVASRLGSQRLRKLVL